MYGNNEIIQVYHIFPKEIQRQIEHLILRELTSHYERIQRRGIKIEKEVTDDYINEYGQQLSNKQFSYNLVYLPKINRGASRFYLAI